MRRDEAKKQQDKAVKAKEEAKQALEAAKQKLEEATALELKKASALQDCVNELEAHVEAHRPAGLQEQLASCEEKSLDDLLAIAKVQGMDLSLVPQGFLDLLRP